MKRLIAPFLAAGLILSTATAAQAVDFKVKGLSQHRISWADRNFTKGNGDDNFKAASRLRTTIEAVVSESLRAWFFLKSDTRTGVSPGMAHPSVRTESRSR